MRVGRRNCAAVMLLLLMLYLSIDGLEARGLFSVTSESSPTATDALLPPAPAPAPPASPALNLTEMLDKMYMPKIPKNLTMHQIFEGIRNFTVEVKNFTLPRLENVTLENGMTAFEFAKALMTGTISSNTADTNTPDKGLSDVQSGAININPFMDGASMSNALTLAGRDATANSRGIVFGMVGTGRSSSEATALGMTGAKASTDTFVINGGGLNQNGMSSNLAFTPQGAADTSVRSAAFNIIGATTSGGLTNAIGKKGGNSAGLGATMTGLGDSYSSQFANSLSEGSTSSNTGVLAGTLTGASKGTVGSVSTSTKRSAGSKSLSTSKSGLGSSTSKSASVSTAAQNATSMSGSYSQSGVGNTASISSTTASGMNADATAESSAQTQAGAASSIAISSAQAVNSASASSNATSKPSTKGIRDSLLLKTHLKLPSMTFTSSKSSSNNYQPTGWGFGKLFNFLHKPKGAAGGIPTTAPLLGEALVSTVGLKALLPSVPKIIPQLPTLNQTVQVNTTPPCNETDLNWNRTANQTWLRCNDTSNSTSPETPLPSPTDLPGLSFFDNLKQMNAKFLEETASPPPPIRKAPPPPPFPASSNTTANKRSGSNNRASTPGGGMGGGGGAGSKIKSNSGVNNAVSKSSSGAIEKKATGPKPTTQAGAAQLSGSKAKTASSTPNSHSRTAASDTSSTVGIAKTTSTSTSGVKPQLADSNGKAKASNGKEAGRSGSTSSSSNSSSSSRSNTGSSKEMVKHRVKSGGQNSGSRATLSKKT